MRTLTTLNHTGQHPATWSAADTDGNSLEIQFNLGQLTVDEIVDNVRTRLFETGVGSSFDDVMETEQMLALTGMEMEATYVPLDPPAPTVDPTELPSPQAASSPEETSVDTSSSETTTVAATSGPSQGTLAKLGMQGIAPDMETTEVDPTQAFSTSPSPEVATTGTSSDETDPTHATDVAPVDTTSTEDGSTGSSVTE